jgi:chemotaxis protein methyltransferase CheR
MTAKKVQFPEELMTRVKSLITDRTGLYFKDHNLSDLQSSVTERMSLRGFDALPSYFSFLTTSENREEEFRELLNLLTVKHTYFFRNETQFQALKEKILPEIISKKTENQKTKTKDENILKPFLRIWSAGCSTGEEPYTIAMIVRDVIPDLENWNIQILATDASEAALSHARKGVYSENSMKHVDAEYIQKYFVKEGRGQYAVCEEIKNMVTFGFFNLMDEDYPEGFDVIFCRNVVIYFEFETTLRVMNKFYLSLINDGYLFIGYSETLQFMQDKFKMLVFNESIYYQKAGIHAREEEKEAARREEIDIDSVLENISRQELQAELTQLTQEEVIQPLTKKENEALLVEIVKCIHLKDYDNALRFADEAIRRESWNLEPHCLAAEIMLNQGRINEARERLASALRVNSFFAPAHFLLGFTFMQEDKFEDAKDNLKKAIYLDKDFLIAHFYLANVFRSMGKLSESIREYRNAIKLLSRHDKSSIIPYSGGFNAATLMSVCHDNLERLKVGEW